VISSLALASPKIINYPFYRWRILGKSSFSSLLDFKLNQFDKLIRGILWVLSSTVQSWVNIMKIIQQTSTLLQFHERKFMDWFGLILSPVFFISFSGSTVSSWYSEPQYIRLTCNVISSIRSEPCTLAHQKYFTAMLESEPVKKVRVDTTQDEDSTTSRLILSTIKKDYSFYYSSIKEVEIHREKVEKMLTSGRVLGTQLESLTVVKDDRLNGLILSIGLGLFALLSAFGFVWMILSTPTHISLKFDKNEDSIVSSSYQFFRRIDHKEFFLSQIQKINWTLSTSISRDESGEEFKTETFNVQLVLRSGEVIPVIPSMWSDYWTFGNSKAFTTTVSRFLAIEVSELS
jgi:hypothetical protein